MKIDSLHIRAFVVSGLIALSLCWSVQLAASEPVTQEQEAQVKLIQSSVSDSSVTTSAFRMIGALCLCLGVLGLGMKLSRKFGVGVNRSPHKRIEVREKIPLSSKTSLLLVAVDNREYLVTSGPENVTLTPTHGLTDSMFAQSLHDVYAESKELHA